MFEFFIALFGGLYYGGKYSREQSRDLTAQKRIENHKKQRAQIEQCFAASYQEEQEAKNYILSGDNFKDICNKFADDFKYVFGNGWTKVLRIPPRAPVLDPKVYRDDAFSFYIPVNHIYWVYALELASRGKVDRWMLSSGYSIGGISDSDIHIKFTQRLEMYLRRYSPDVKLVLEQTHENITPTTPYGGYIKIQPMCVYPSYRLW